MPDPRDPASLSLDDLFAEGVPKSPIEDFERLVADLQNEVLAAKRRQEAEEAETLRRADRLVEDLRAEIERTREQIRVLEALRGDFVAVGEFGGPALGSIRDALAALDAHLQTMESRLRHPELERANARRLEKIRQLRDRLPERLRPEAPVDDVETAIDEMLRLGLPGEDRSVETLMESFEAAIRERDAFRHLPAVLRFWKNVSRRGDETVARAARDRAQAIEREIGEREARREANERAAREAQEIRRALEGLDRLGPAEQYAELALWLGRLRRFQDDFDLDEEAAREVRYSFGAINNARKRLEIDGYFDALDRSYSTNWERYIADWERKLPEARRQDLLDREEERRREAERARRAKEDAEAEAERQARLDGIVAELAAIAGTEAWRTDPEAAEEIRDLLIAGVEADGCAQGKFVDAAVPFAPLAQGGDLRRLRRALAKRGIEFEASAAAPATEGDAALSALRPAWEGRRLAIAGGLPRPEIVDRLRSGIGLGEVRWFECFHGRDQLDQADASIRSGAFDHVLLLVRFSSHKLNLLRDACAAAAVPYRMVDRGCGVQAIARALASV